MTMDTMHWVVDIVINVLCLNVVITLFQKYIILYIFSSLFTSYNALYTLYTLLGAYIP